MIADTFYGLREMLLPGPSQTTGYRTVLVIGTTGAGKTTLVRQILGTDPDGDGFPATSASKTTVAEAELLLAPGDYYAVVTFMPQHDVRRAVSDNVVAAAMAIFEDRSDADVRQRLLEHADQRFRLNYVLSPGANVDADVMPDPVHEKIRTNTEAVLVQITELLDETVAAELSAMADEGAMDANAELGDIDEIHERLKDRITAHPIVSEVVDFLVEEIRIRFDLVNPSELYRGTDGWPLYWRSNQTDRTEFLRGLRKFTSNNAAEFGTLLTPIANGIRVRGPFHPQWSAEIPYLMLVDREGLGHTPDSASSLPSATTRMLDDVDSIVIVDNGQQPMQAAPTAALRQIAAMGHGAKTILAFTHFEQVQGPNLPDLAARRHHVVASVDQVLTSVGSDLGYSVERLLRHRLDRNCYFLSRLNENLVPERDERTLSELRWLIHQMRAEGSAVDLDASKPIYRLADVATVVHDAISRFQLEWEARLGLTNHAGFSAVHPSKIKALCERLATQSTDEYDALRPAGDLLTHLSDAARRLVIAPSGWTGPAPSDDREPQIHDLLAQRINQRLRTLVNTQLIENSSELWSEAASIDGPKAAIRRAEFIQRKILDQQVPSSGGSPVDNHACFADAAVGEAKAALNELGIELT